MTILFYLQMLSSKQAKHLKSLHLKKFRNRHHEYLLEGEKMVLESLDQGAHLLGIWALQDWVVEHDLEEDDRVNVCSEKELKSISQLKSPSQAIAWMKIPEMNSKALDDTRWAVALQDVQDPGNLGTIIRTLDWFGIHQLILTPNTVDQYNAKVLQSTMGSCFRVKIIREDLNVIMNDYNQAQLPVYATCLDGEPIKNLNAPKPGLIVFGNESKGLPDAIKAKADHKILIEGNGGAESLNVGVSVGIVLSWLVG